MIFSVRDRIHQYADTQNRSWKHDRSKTVGASEIGACARKTYFSKTNTQRDEDYIDGWGVRVRGHVIEDELWVPALRATLQPGEQLLFAGEEQQTLTSGYLSATTDGLLVMADGECINLDGKSIDPRANISKEKPLHHFQVQAQAGLIRECTEYKPEISILSYIDTSFWDKITEFVVPFNPRIYAQAHARATQIMTARTAMDLPPEGKMAGGNECEFCAWASHCADVTVAGVPRHKDQLGDNAANHLKELREAERKANADKKESKANHAKAVEDIKAFLRNNNTSRHRGDGWSVSYSVVAGRETLDIKAVEEAGIDLTPFYKTGRSSERLTVR